MIFDLTAAVVAFAVTARARGHSTPWCVDLYVQGVTGLATLLFRLGPVQLAPPLIGPTRPGDGGPIVCAPVMVA